jgi:hypothetical protein
MNDQRRVRFATLGTMTRDDLPICVDIWLEDALKAPWATRETMKLAGVMANYILRPSRDVLGLRAIEDQHQLHKDYIRRALGLMSLFGAIEAFSLADDELRVAMRLSRLQTLRALEVKAKLAVLEPQAMADASDENGTMSAEPEASWLPEFIEQPMTAEPVETADGEIGRTARLLLSRFAEAMTREGAKDAGLAKAKPGEAEKAAAPVATLVYETPARRSGS